MKRPPSVRGRLATALLFWSLLWSLGVGLAVALAAQHELDELLDETLQATAVVLGRALALSAPGNGEVLPVTGEGEFAWQQLDAAGRVLRRSANAPAAPLLRAGSAGLSRASGWRVHASSFGDAGGTLLVAHTLEERSEAQLEVVVNAVFAALSIGLLGHLWLRVRVRDELRPLERLSQRLERHDPLDPAQALGTAERAELVPVHDAIDQLGRRLAQRVQHERMVAAHAAHALRTPLAGMDAQLAVALRESAPEAQPRLQRVREASGRLQRVVRSLLDLFRIGADVQRQRVALPALLAHLPVPGLQVVAAPQSHVDADPDLLAAALANLLDNAQRHGARRVEVAVTEPNRLRVSNDGLGIEPQRLAALREALRSQAYDGQTGLGLMLADLVARAHGGRLDLPDVAAGFAVELRLGPEAADAPRTGAGE
jgi:signal transduction histidine kinase